MSTWKKIVVSGSDAHLSSVSASVSLGVNSNQRIGITQDLTRLTGSFTGSFVGNGSGLTNITTASYVLNAVSSSFASNSLTASYYGGTVTSASFATTASYALQALSSSFATTSNTASYVLNSVSSSFASTASYWSGTVTSASYSETASYWSGTVTSASYSQTSTTASYVLNSVSSSFATTASFVRTAYSASLATSASYATIVEFPINQISNATATTTFFVNTDVSQNPSSNRNIGWGDLLTDIAGTNLASDGDSINLNTTVTGLTSVSSTSFTGSLQGTATTASYVFSSVSSSFASTASFVNTLAQNVTVSGSVFLSGSLNTPVFIDYEERFTSPTISAGGLTLNLADGNVFNVALNAAITTLTISSPPASNNAGSFVLIFTADGTPRAVAWGASVSWPGGTAPTLTSTNGKKDVFGFISLNSGTNWYGFIGGQNI